MRRVCAVLLCSGVGMVACGAGREPVPARPAAAPQDVSAARPTSAQELDNPFADEIARALELVGRVRQLPAKHPVKGRVLDREEMVLQVKRSIRKEVPPDVIKDQEEMLFALDAVPVNFDYERSLLQLVEDQLAGFYEPEDQTMYLGGDLGPTARWATLAHELVHALQDQYYDLEDEIEYREDGTDEQSAVLALAEGDATSAMFDVLQGRPATEMSEAGLGMMFRGSVEMGSGDDVPELLKRSLVSPYVDGIGLVHWARRRGGWAAVDALWRRRPASTEQVLHPEKWEAGEAPLTVQVPPPPGDGWKLEYHDVLGEQSLRLLFEEWMPRFRAVAAASDWGGDRVALYVRGNQWALAWRIVFDDEEAAVRGAAAFARGVLAANRAHGTTGEFSVTQEAAEGAAGRGAVCVERAEAGPFAVVRNGRAVGVIGGPYRRLRRGAAEGSRSCGDMSKWLTRVSEAGGKVAP